MYAAHFAAALAIKASAPRASTGALVVLASAPDLAWLALSVAGIEVVTPQQWFDGWSHSIASISIQALFAAAAFHTLGSRVMVAAACAVLSHMVLDLPMHPAPLQWFPHARSGMGDFLHGWSGRTALLGKTIGWWTEAVIVIGGTAAYVAARRRIGIGLATALASAMLVGSLHLAFG